MSTWFSATFVLPELGIAWSLTDGHKALLTMAVQAGFVLGALGAAATGAADSFTPRALIMVGGFGASACNLVLLWSDGPYVAIPARFATGVFLALVYPSALKEVSTWFRQGRGLALGAMVGALTIGSALPHLVAASGHMDWRSVIIGTSVLAALGALAPLLLRRSGPYCFPRGRVSLGAGWRSMRDRSVFLANIGYMGHMWELYAMWATIGTFILSLPRIADPSTSSAVGSLLAFTCIALGAAGAIVGGLLSDRWGRARSALLSLICSGGAALLLAVSHQALPFWCIIAICGFWGFWVIADSAQFSALVSEHAEPPLVGSALALQLALGYGVTIFSLWLVPQIISTWSWTAAFLIMAVGPVFGALAMFGITRRRSH